jgi:hypothetical protein
MHIFLNYNTMSFFKNKVSGYLKFVFREMFPCTISICFILYFETEFKSTFFFIIMQCCCLATSIVVWWNFSVMVSTLCISTMTIFKQWRHLKLLKCRRCYNALFIIDVKKANVFFIQDKSVGFWRVNLIFEQQIVYVDNLLIWVFKDPEFLPISKWSQDKSPFCDQH